MIKFHQNYLVIDRKNRKDNALEPRNAPCLKNQFFNEYPLLFFEARKYLFTKLLVEHAAEY